MRSLTSATQCERQSENLGSMPFSSLSRIRPDRLMTSNGAWQQWTGLPEGASSEFVPDTFTNLSNPSRYFTAELQTLARHSASPCAERSRALHRPRRPRSQGRGCGYFEDGVPHAEALSPFKRFVPLRRSVRSPRSAARSALVVSALASTHQTSPK